MSELLWEAMATEDDEPWGVYVYGHHDLAAFASEAYRARMLLELERIGIENPADWLADKPAEHLWMRDTNEDDAGSDDYSMHYCAAGDPGAIAITGVRFP